VGVEGNSAPVVQAEQTKIARLRAELARLRMERDIAKKPRRTLLRTCPKGRLDPVDEDALADHADVPDAGGQRERVLRLGGLRTQARASRRTPSQQRGLLAHIRSIHEHLRGEYGWLPLQPEVSGHAGFLGHARRDVTTGESLALKVRRLT
jgi:hypothetical protein